MAIDTNGRPTVKDIYSILADPDKGVLVTMARIDARLAGVETSLGKHNTIHAELNDHISQLQTESDERRGEERADDKRHLKANALFGFLGAIIGGVCALLAGAIF